MALLPLPPRPLLRQPSHLARISERHWLARDLVFAHSGYGAFIFGRPVADTPSALRVRALEGNQHPGLRHSAGWAADSTNYETYDVGIALAMPLTLSAWWYGPAGTTVDPILGVRRSGANAGGWSLDRNSTESPLARAMSTAGTSTTVLTTGYSFVASDWTHGVAFFESTTSRGIYGNGGSETLNTTLRTGPSDATQIIVAGSVAATAGAANSVINGIALPIVLNRRLSAAEVAELYEEQRSNPWALFTERKIWVPVSSGGGGTTHDVSVAETASATDSPSAASAAAASVSEAGSAADSPSASAVLEGAIAEAATAADTVDATAGAGGSVSESATATEAVDATVQRAASIAEAAAAAEAASAVAELLASIAEAAAAADSVAVSGDTPTLSNLVAYAVTGTTAKLRVDVTV